MSQVRSPGSSYDGAKPRRRRFPTARPDTPALIHARSTESRGSTSKKQLHERIVLLDSRPIHRRAPLVVLGAAAAAAAAANLLAADVVVGLGGRAAHAAKKLFQAALRARGGWARCKNCAGATRREWRPALTRGGGPRSAGEDGVLTDDLRIDRVMCERWNEW